MSKLWNLTTFGTQLSMLRAANSGNAAENSCLARKFGLITLDVRNPEAPLCITAFRIISELDANIVICYCICIYAVVVGIDKESDGIPVAYYVISDYAVV